jgi:hypothetical protein
MSRCPEKKDCRWWKRLEFSTESDCYKPRHLICPADDVKKVDEDSDGVPELRLE